MDKTTKELFINAINEDGELYYENLDLDFEDLNLNDEIFLGSQEYECYIYIKYKKSFYKITYIEERLSDESFYDVQKIEQVYPVEITETKYFTKKELIDNNK